MDCRPIQIPEISSSSEPQVVYDNSRPSASDRPIRQNSTAIYNGPPIVRAVPLDDPRLLNMQPPSNTPNDTASRGSRRDDRTISNVWDAIFN